MHQTASVYVNDIEIGAIPVEQYESMRKKVRSDKWILFSQAVNTLWVLFNFAVRSLLLVPALWLLILFFALLFAPDDLVASLQDIAQLPIKETIAGLRKVFAVSVVFTVMAWGLRMACSAPQGRPWREMGYIDHYETALNHQLRTLLESPAEGTLRVMIWPVDWPARSVSSVE